MKQQNIDSRLARIEKSLKYIQENMIDVDVILIEEERKMLDKSIENERSGKLISSKKLRQELRI